MNKIAIGIALVVLLIGAAIYWAFKSKSPFGPHPEAVQVEVLEEWNLPIILEEVSGIAFLDKERIAAVQDEEGIIFIYNLTSRKIEQQIPFAKNGDYEGIALVGATAYVLRSDGAIFEVQNFQEENRMVTMYETGLEAVYNSEGLCYDPTGNRLLIAIKDKAGDDFKPVFAFDLKTKALQEEPAFKIYFGDRVFDILDQKPAHTVIRPSEINIHPETGNIYILEGKVPKLLVLDPKGNPLELYMLDLEQFPQAEGLAFSPDGELYISNESNNNPPNILKINLEP